MESLRVSAILRTYNRGYILGEALASALGQTCQAFEIVVVDDGSTDDTAEVVCRSRAGNLKYVRHERNRGVAAAANSGIQAASGNVLAFLDSDDLWKPAMLQRLTSFLSRHPDAGAVFCDAELIGGHEVVPSLIAVMNCFPRLLRDRARHNEHLISAREMYLCLLEEVPAKPSTMLIRREVIDRVGFFKEAWRSGEDWELFLRMSRSCDFGFIDEVLVTQRVGADSTFLKFAEQDKQFLLDLFLAEKAALLNDPAGTEAVNRGIAMCCRELGLRHLLAGRRGQSAAAYWRGFLQTRRLPMLLRLASVAMPVGVRQRLRRAIKGG